MKYIVFVLSVLCISCSLHRVTRASMTWADEQEKRMVDLLDSIQRFPDLYDVTLAHPDSALMGHLKDKAHVFAGFWRYGRNRVGKEAIQLYNREYARTYTIVIDNKVYEDFDIDALDPATVQSMTILTDRPGMYVSHCLPSSEYLIIITLKKSTK